MSSHNSTSCETGNMTSTKMYSGPPVAISPGWAYKRGPACPHAHTASTSPSEHSLQPTLPPFKCHCLLNEDPWSPFPNGDTLSSVGCSMCCHSFVLLFVRSKDIIKFGSKKDLQGSAECLLLYSIRHTIVCAISKEVKIV